MNRKQKVICRIPFTKSVTLSLWWYGLFGQQMVGCVWETWMEIVSIVAIPFGTSRRTELIHFTVELYMIFCLQGLRWEADEKQTHFWAVCAAGGSTSSELVHVLLKRSDASRISEAMISATVALLSITQDYIVTYLTYDSTKKKTQGQKVASTVIPLNIIVKPVD